MVWVDTAILLVIGVSALISVFRGLVREVLSLVAWAVAFAAAAWLHEPVARLAEGTVSVPSVRLAGAALAVFVVVLLACGLVNWAVVQLVKATGLSGTDRALGMLFGAARGLAIVTLLVMLAGYTPVTEDPWWRESVLLRHIEPLAAALRAELAEPVAGHLSFTPR